MFVRPGQVWELKETISEGYRTSNKQNKTLHVNPRFKPRASALSVQRLNHLDNLVLVFSFHNLIIKYVYNMYNII